MIDFKRFIYDRIRVSPRRGPPSPPSEPISVIFFILTVSIEPSKEPPLVNIEESLEDLQLDEDMGDALTEAFVNSVSVLHSCMEL